MTPDDFRRLALALPEAVESEHMGHPDFRVRKKIFATLWPDDGYGVVKLTPEQQTVVTHAAPAMFAPVPGGWGRGGSTRVLLAAAAQSEVKRALAMAWRNKAPKTLADPEPDR